jgi:hypothetical protein
MNRKATIAVGQEVRFDWDPRKYHTLISESNKQIQVQSQAIKQINGVDCHCSFHQRHCDWLQMTPDKAHSCALVRNSSTIADQRTNTSARNKMDELMTGLVLFLASVNVSVLACAMPEMRHFLFPTFRMGWQSRDQKEFAQTDPMPAFQNVNHQC